MNSHNFQKIFNETKYSEETELEIRFGFFEKTKFTPYLHSSSYRLLMNYLSSETKIVKDETTFNASHSGGIKVVQILDRFDFPWNTAKLIGENFQLKSKLSGFSDNHEYNYRVSSSSDKTVDNLPEEQLLSLKNDPVKYFKLRRRFSFMFGNVLYELSMYKSGLNYQQLCSCPMMFEVEIERTEATTLEDFKTAINTVLTMTVVSHFDPALGIKSLLPESLVTKTRNGYFNLIGKSTFGGVQPETFREEKLVAGEDYSVTLKLDGLRVHIYIDPSGDLFLICNSLKLIQIPGYSTSHDCILEAELHDCKLYVFDCLYSSGNDLRDRLEYGLQQRLEYARIIIKTIETVTEIKIKEYFYSNLHENTLKLAKIVEESPGLYDGLIFVPTFAGYPKSKNKFIPLKWKPSRCNSIDLHLKKIEITDKHEIWELYHQTANDLQLFKPENFETLARTKISRPFADHFFDQTVAEFVYDLKIKKMVPVRDRLDKTKPNFETISLDNWNSIVSPQSFNCLLPKKEVDIVIEQVNPFYNMRRFHNFVKRRILTKYPARSLLDLACGKGGDIQKWIDNDIKYVEGFDFNKESIIEANNRFEKASHKATTKNFDFKFSVCNLLEEQVKPKFNDQFDMVTCQFALHYFCENMDIFAVFLKTNIIPFIKKNGYFIGCLFDGESLVKALPIVSSNCSLTKNGQNVIVKIKDTVLEEATEEPIVNYSDMKNTLETLGFEIVESEMFSVEYQEWRKKRNTLNPEELQLSSLNRYFVFKYTGKPTIVTEILKRKTPPPPVDWSDIMPEIEEKISKMDIVETKIEPQVTIPKPKKTQKRTSLSGEPKPVKEKTKTLKELKQECVDKGLPPKGTKAELIEKLDKFNLTM